MEKPWELIHLNLQCMRGVGEKEVEKEKFSFTQFSTPFTFHSREINSSTDGTVKLSLIVAQGLEWYLCTYKQSNPNELKPTQLSVTKNSLNQNFQSCSSESRSTSLKMPKLSSTELSYFWLNLHISAFIPWISAIFLLHLKLLSYCHHFRQLLNPQSTLDRVGQ